MNDSYFKFVLDLTRDKNNQYPSFRISYTNTFAKPPWFELVEEEYKACRERIGLSDYSSFTKIDLWVSYRL